MKNVILTISTVAALLTGNVSLVKANPFSDPVTDAFNAATTKNEVKTIFNNNLVEYSMTHVDINNAQLLGRNQGIAGNWDTMILGTNSDINVVYKQANSAKKAINDACDIASDFTTCQQYAINVNRSLRRQHQAFIARNKAIVEYMTTNNVSESEARKALYGN